MLFMFAFCRLFSLFIVANNEILNGQRNKDELGRLRGLAKMERFSLGIAGN
jgi:hypothetical protein